MTLKELQKMIKEEFDAYQNEAADDVDVSVTDDDVDVDAEMGDDDVADGEEDVLRAIYDLLATHFGGEGEEEMGDEEMGDEEGEETVDEFGIGVGANIGEDEGADLEEGDGYDGKTTGSTKGAPYVGKKGATKNAPYTASSQALQERFQKLANIIK